MEALLATLPAAGGGAVAAAAVAVGLAAITGVQMEPKKRPNNAPPEVPGLPLLGNIHQLTGTKPHKTFIKWSETYGPIYSARLGNTPAVVLNSTELVREAMVDKFSSISSRNLTKAFSVISRDKLMVSMSDYGDFHKNGKRSLITAMLGAPAQKKFRDTRKQMMDNLISTFSALVMDDPHATKNFRDVFRAEIFRLNLTQGFGEAVSSVYVEEFGREVSTAELCEMMVVDVLTSLAVVDWRDFFPQLSWIPNKSFDERVRPTEYRRTAVTRALINYRKKRIACGEARESYLDFLLAENTLTDEEMTVLAWEAVLGGTDTTLMGMEWAMYHLANNPEIQDRLYREIQEVCGNDTFNEDHLPHMPYLKAVFHETLRLHPPGPLLPPKFVRETTTLGGYQVPAGTELIINIYGCNTNKDEWEQPEEWRPERFLDDKKFGASYKPLTFGAGKRICAGVSQATTISCSAIARFVQEFAWSLEPGEADKVETEQYIGGRLHPLHVKLSPRGGK